MARSKHPVLTVKELRSLSPGEYIKINNVTRKMRSVISSMICYVKDMGLLPHRVKGYTCTCDGDEENKECRIYAMGKGDNGKDYRSNKKGE